MLTARGWWCLLCMVLMTLAGALSEARFATVIRSPPGLPLLAVPGLALLAWFGVEWVLFVLRARILPGQLRITREVRDDRGPVTTLWAGRSFTVRAALELHGAGRLPHVVATDPVPFGVRIEDGSTTVDGALTSRVPLEVEYTVYCPLPGQARFEGMRIALSDLQGFFAFTTFLRSPVALPVLPAVLVARGGGPMVKRHNEMPPPGTHRLRRPGSGGELLDLRDYIPGDPPRTIAWKVSARRDRLVTKEFESEVPVRVTLFLDISDSVRLPSPSATMATESRKAALGAGYFKPLDRMVEIAAIISRAGANIRDMIGLCLFDEHGCRAARPERSAVHQTRLMQILAEAATLAPSTSKADPEALLRVAYGLASEVYPDLLRDEVNRLPWYLALFSGQARYTRHRRGLLAYLHRHLRLILLYGMVRIPLGMLSLAVLTIGVGVLPEWAETILLALLMFGSPLLVVGTVLLFCVVFLASGRERRLAKMRKKVAAILSLRAAAAPGGLQAMLEDDDLLALHLQRFLAEHQVPVATSLYDEEGRYLFACPEKLPVLAKALITASAHGCDNELFVLLADLLELDQHLEPLLSAVRVALGRHHQVMLVCPWPQNVPLPSEELRTEPGQNLGQLLTGLAERKLHDAYARIRKAFGRLGVQVICAGSEESPRLILQRVERLRSQGGRR